MICKSIPLFLPGYFYQHPIVGFDGQAKTDPADTRRHHLFSLLLLRYADRVLHKGKDRYPRKDRSARKMAGKPKGIRGYGR